MSTGNQIEVTTATLAAKRPMPSLRSAFRIVCAVLIVTGASVAVPTYYGMSTATFYLQRAGWSYEQLAAVTKLEADVNGWLLSEALRQQSGASQPQLADPAEIEKSLALYIDSIRSEAKSLRTSEERMKESEELEQAQRLREDFHALAAALRKSDGATIRSLSDGFRARVHLIVEGERGEVAETSVEMSQLRKELNSWAALLLGATGLTIALLFAFAYRGLVLPIAQLSIGAARFGAGERNIHIPATGARELRELAGQFNTMIEKLSRQQKQLMESNDHLEETVRIRTRDLEAKTEQLAEIDRSRRLFFAKVGHELRTPVTVMKGEADVALRRTSLDESGLREALHHISASGEALGRRLDDLLTLARSEDGRLSIAKAPFDVEACAGKAVSMARAYASSSGVHLKLDGGDGPYILHGDESWLRQALLALIDNAVKFSPDDGLVRISLERGPHAMTLSVTDQGPGAPAEDVAHLFKPFFKASKGLQSTGSGLGLAVARWVTEAHGGQIFAANAATGGLVVNVVLPAGPQ